MKGALLGMALSCMTACLNPDLTPCGELLCSAGSVCVNDRVCATQDQIDACGGIEEKAPCQATFGQGYCSEGVCVANVCGDGVVTGNEACDGSTLTLTCAAFGFYEGTVTCDDNCVPQPAACVGSCGDGIVQSTFGEQCDGSAPPETCLDFGRDYGVLTCNSFCAPAITSDCERYGWEFLLPATRGYSAAAANAHGVVGLDVTTIDVVWNGVASTRANTGGWTHAAANASVLVVVGPTSVLWFDGQWHDMTAGIANPSWISVSDDGFVFGRSGSTGCTIDRIELSNAAKTTLPVPAQACSHGVALSLTKLYVSQATEGVRVYDGVNWTSVVSGTVTSIYQAGPQKIAALATTLRIIDVSGASPTVTTRIGTATGVEAFDNDGNQLRAYTGGDNGSLVFDMRAQDMLFEMPSLVEDAQVGLGRTGDGRLLTYGKGVLAMRPLQVSYEIGSNPTIRAIARAGNGLLACGSGVYVSGLGGLVSRPYSSGTSGGCVAITGDSVGAHFVLSESDVVYRYNAGSNLYETVSTSSGASYTDIAGDFGQLYVATSTGILGSTAGGAVVAESVPAGCTIARLAMSPNRKFVGLGGCNGTVAVFERTTSWQTIATTALPLVQTSVGIAIGNDDTIVVRHGTDIYRLDGTTLTAIGTGDDVEIVTRDDIFIAQGGDAMLHLTPTSTQSLRLPSGPFAASATHLFAWDRSRRSIVGITRVTGQPGGP